MRALYLISVWLHILAASAWIGGMLFLVLVLVPMLRRPETRVHAAPLFHAIGTRFRGVGWVGLVTLVVTGVVNLICRGFGLADIVSGRVFATGPWGQTLAHKLVLVTTVLTLGVVHDFFVGPTAVRLADENAPAARRERYRRAASWMGRVTLLLALAIVALAVKLVR